MIRLIKAELKKIFSKKSFYVVTIIFMAYCVLTNVIYKNINNLSYQDNDININELKEINNKLDLKNSDDLSEYISNLSIIEVEELKENFNENTPLYLIDSYIANLINDRNEALYIAKDLDLVSKINLEISDLYEKIEKNDWQYFTNEKISRYKTYIKNTSDKSSIKKFNEVIKLEEYRLKNSVAYDTDNFMFIAIDNIETDLTEYYNLQNKENLTKAESNRLADLKEMMLKNYYVLDNKVDLNNMASLQMVLREFTTEFSLFILIYVILICGSIVSEEYSKGTIKYLLTKPYKRSTILTSKLFTVLLLIPIIIIFMLLIEVIIGGFIFGFSSLSVPVVLYNSNTTSLATYNIFIYTIKSLISELPMYLVLGIVCFALSTITRSTSAATTITFLFYLLGGVITNLALTYNLKILKYFVSVHWSFRYLVDFASNPFKINPWISLLVVVSYIAVILCLTYLYFNKKDVKNI